MKIIAFAASTSTQSINKQLVSYVAHLVPNSEVELLDLNDFELPLFSEDLEREIGKPKTAAEFLKKLGSGDAIIISFAEHNGLYTAAFKNLFDWCSRQAGHGIYQNQPMLLLATSNGARGARTVLDLALTMTPRFGGDVRASVSVPLFDKNFDRERGEVVNPEIVDEIKQAITELIN
jgi:NAD(P)H-dependent FMN reductase